jgi:hypothetical protein
MSLYTSQFILAIVDLITHVDTVLWLFLGMARTLSASDVRFSELTSGCYLPNTWFCSIIDPVDCQSGFCLYGTLSNMASIVVFSAVCSTRWMAPESYYDGIWDLTADVWMFGVLLWGMLSR